MSIYKKVLERISVAIISNWNNDDKRLSIYVIVQYEWKYDFLNMNLKKLKHSLILVNYGPLIWIW